MSKLYFCDYLSRALRKSKIRSMLADMEATPDETRLMLERFCDGKPASVIHDEWMSEKKQKEVAESLSGKFEAHFWDGIATFKPCEIEAILKIRLNLKK